MEWTTSPAFTDASGNAHRLRWRFVDDTLRVERLDASGAATDGWSGPSRFAGNFGGDEFVISPRGNFVALFMFSGQCEHGYELFRVHPAFEHLPSHAFDCAQGDPPVFAPDESALVLVNDAPGSRSFLGEDDDRPRAVAVGDGVFFSRIIVHDLARGRPLAVHDVIVDLDGVEHDPDRWYAGPEGPRFVDVATVELTLPWGVATFRLPLDEGADITVRGPPEGWVEGDNR